jgi:hypothetical protein
MHKKAIAPILCFLAVISASLISHPTARSAPSDTASIPVEVDHIENGTVRFKPLAGGGSLKPLQTQLHDLKIIGSLQGTEGGYPYLIFSALPCASCTQERNVYISRASGGKIHQFTFPGRILDPKTRALLFEARSFMGRCLSEPKDVYVVFQREKVDRRSGMMTSTLIVEGGKEHIEERFLERRLPSIKTTLAKVKAKQCVELEGRYRIMSNKPFNLNPRSNSNNNTVEEDKEGDDQIKENQTEKELPSQKEEEDEGERPSASPSGVPSAMPSSAP